MRIPRRVGRVGLGLAVALGAAARGAPQSSSTVTVQPGSVAVAPGEASASLLVGVTLAGASRAGETFGFDVELPAALGGTVQAEPPRLVVSIPPGGRSGSARFRFRAGTQAPPGTYMVAVRETQGRGAATVALTVTGAPGPGAPGTPSPGRAGGLQLELQPASAQLCDGGEPLTLMATVSPSRDYRGRPRLRFRPLPAGVSVTPPVADLPPVPPPQSAAFRLQARGASSGRHLIALEAEEAGRGVLDTAALTLEVASADVSAASSPAAPVVRQGAPPLALALSIQGNRCFAAAAVSVSLTGLPAGLVVTPAAATLVGPGFAPAAFQLRASPAVQPGDYRLVATFTGGAVSRRLEIPVKVEPPGVGERLRMPRIDAVEPEALRPGGRYTLQLQGQNLDPGTTLSFGAGIQVLGPPLVASPTRATVEVLVAPAAAPGVRVAVARSSVGESKGPGGVRVEVLSAPPAAGPAPIALPLVTPRVDDVKPAVLERGKAYLLKLTGQNLAAAQGYGFGKGITVAPGSLTPLSDTQVALQAQVAADAPAGKRWAIAFGGAGSSQGPGSVAVTAPAPKPKPPVVVPGPPVLPLGKIILDAPKTATYPKGIDPGAPVEYVVPKLHDETKLEWHEQNPGTADYFELRFLDASGQKVLASERIDPLGVPYQGKVFKLLPTFFRPSAALVAQLAAQVPKTGGVAMAGVPPPAGPPVPADAPIVKAPGASPPAPAAGSSPKLATGKRDFLWEVAGYALAASAGGEKVALASGTGAKPQGGLALISERWPLALAGQPTGLTCPAGGAASGKFALANTTGTAGGAVLVGDALALSGTFDFSHSPYAVHAVGIKTPLEEAESQIAQAQKQLDKANPLGSKGGSGAGTPKLQTHSRWKFDTVFVDWGDGTAEPLVADGTAPSLSFHSGLPLQLPVGPRAACGPGAPYLHCYENPGTYTVRIYQLPTDAAQKASPGSGTSAKGGAPAGSASLVLTALGQAPVAAASGGVAIGQAAAELAYMLYCRSVTVLPPPDLCAEGPLQLAQIEIIGFPGHEPPSGKAGEALGKPVMPGGSSTKGAAPQGVATTCDTFLTAQARLHYVGKGTARVRWRYEDGTVLKEEVLTLQSPKTQGPPAKGGGVTLDTRDDLYSPVLPVSELGVHGLRVEAEVLHDPMAILLQAAAQGQTPLCPIEKSWSPINALDEICKKEPLFCPGASKAPSSPAAGGLEVGLVLTGPFAGAPGAGKGGVQPLGSLPPVVAGVSLDPKPSGKKDPPEFVQSQQVHYKVLSPDPAKPCFFLFPTQRGDFIVADTNLSVTQVSPGVYTGKGVLQLPLTQSSALAYFPVPTKIAQWKAADGVHVTQGQIQEAPGLGLQAPASQVTLVELQGSAGVLLSPRLGVSPVSKLLIDAQAEGAPRWTAHAPLSSQGDWIASALATPRLAIGYSGFELAPWQDVTLDFSLKEGQPPASASCGAGGSSFTGIHLGKAPLSIYQFDVTQPGASPLRTIDGWVIGAAGLCGEAAVAGLPKLTLGDGGFIQSGPLKLSAAAGGFYATFQGLQVFSPWFSKPGNQPLGPVDAVFFDSSGPDDTYFKIPGLGSPPSQDWGAVTLAATNLELTRVKGLGWALGGDFDFAFRDHTKKPFTQLSTSSLAIDLVSGFARFGGGQTQQSFPLAGAGGPPPHLGETPLLLQSLNLSGQASGERRLFFDFDGTLKLSQANQVLPDAPAHVVFEVLRQGTSYTAPSPKTPSFALKAAFPAGKSPTSEAALSLQYVPGSTFYCGQLELSLLGGAGLGAGTGTFVLGYDGKGKDGWLAHYEVPLAGGAGIPIAPPLPVNLFRIDGGLGYNIDGKAFADPLTCKTPFQIKDTGVVFSAGLRAGTSDRSTLTLDGQLTIDPGAATRFDVDAWLLRSNPTGKGDIEGVLQWSDGAFRGKFWGGYRFLEDPTGLFGGHAVDLSLGSGEGDAAVDLLVSKSGDWHVWAGQNPKYKSGPPVSGRVLFATSKVWLMVGGQGLANLDLDVGGQQKLEVGGCVWECCAKAYAEFGCGLELKLNPPGVKGSASAEFGVSLCGVGFSLGGNASLGCCPPSAHVELCAEIKPCLDWDGLCDACAGFDL